MPTDLHYFNRDWITHGDTRLDADLCVYGGTSAGVAAAVAAARRGRRVVLLNPGRHLGGMSSGGLGCTDIGNKHVIGGLSRSFYRTLGKHYGKDEAWTFEPRAAEAVFNAWADDHGIDMRHGQFLDRVHKERGRIVALTCLGGLTVGARCYIDATYEGDLLAAAGVSYHVGRESNAVYNETLNGAQIRGTHQFSHPVDPYRVAGDPSSGPLPQVEPVDQHAHIGEGDHRVQAYCFRVCMTDDPALKIDWQKPDRFVDAEYELARRWFNSEKDRYNENLTAAGGPKKFDDLKVPTPSGGRKTDTNNHGAFSSDFIGANWPWPEADYVTRERIFQRHVSYQQGFYWFMANDPSIPQRYREAYGAWGLPRDEFVDTGHWPPQLYVREARRMVSDYVITEHDCTGAARADDSVGMASYTMDSHNCTRFICVENGKARVMNEGDVQVPPTDPYPISYRAVVPQREQCTNLFVPVCISASHIAFGSARMEPVFMVLGESCGIAADLCDSADCDAQALPYDELRPELEKAAQVLHADAGIGPGEGNP